MTEDQIIAIPMGIGNQGVPQQQRNDRADLMDKIKPDLLVEVIRHRLLGEEFLNNQWVAVEALKNRKLTDIGAWEIANLMLGVSSTNISISKLNDTEIKRRLLGIAKTAQKILVGNWKSYGLNSTSQMWYVHEIVFSNTLGVLKQADEASIQELLKGTIQENRNINAEVKREGKLKGCWVLTIKMEQSTFFKVGFWVFFLIGSLNLVNLISIYKVLTIAAILSNIVSIFFNFFIARFFYGMIPGKADEMHSDEIDKIMKKVRKKMK